MPPENGFKIIIRRQLSSDQIDSYIIKVLEYVTHLLQRKQCLACVGFTVYPSRYECQHKVWHADGGTNHAFYTKRLCIQVIFPNKLFNDLHGKSSIHHGFRAVWEGEGG